MAGPFDRVPGIDRDAQLPLPVRERMAQNFSDPSTPEGAELSATIADAIASTGGGTVTDDTYLWIYDYVNNVMPAPPSEAPAGCKLVEAIAPIAPTFAPWMGIGPGKVFTRLYIAEG